MSLEDALRRVRARVADRYPEVLRQREIRHLESLWDLLDGDVTEGDDVHPQDTASSVPRQHDIDYVECLREGDAQDDPPVVRDTLA